MHFGFRAPLTGLRAPLTGLRAPHAWAPASQTAVEPVLLPQLVQQCQKDGKTGDKHKQGHTGKQHYKLSQIPRVISNAPEG